MNDTRVNETLLERFKPQQVQASAGRAPPDGAGPLRRVAAVLRLAPEGATSLVVHLDQTEQLLGFRLRVHGCSLDEVSVSLSRYVKHGRYEAIPGLGGPSSGPEALIRLPAGDPVWALGVKLTAQWASPRPRSPDATLELSIQVSDNAFAHEARRLNLNGVLKAASDRNAQRLDDSFDTEHINSGVVLSRLPRVVGPDDAIPGNALYPRLDAPELNLVGEPIEDGITMFVHLMNRNGNVLKNLPNWLEQRFDELILLDWSSEDPVADLPGIFADPRLRVVRVEGQTKFVRTLAQNLAIRVARRNRIFKCDSDVELKGDFFAAHPLAPGEFWVGDWHHARDHNERHLHGETYCFVQDLLSVGGYDERIKSYGQDDTNLKDRMVLAGYTKKVFDYNFMAHQPHEQSQRAQGSHGVHPMVATYANRLMTRTQPLWSARSVPARYDGIVLADRVSIFEVREAPAEATTQDHIRQAMRTIALWYADPQQVGRMSDAEINEMIWERQVE